MGDDRREALNTEYGQVCSNFRTLTDIRFKLLGLLPIATATGAAFNGGQAHGGSFVFALFGLIATIGLVTYNTRNDQLYDELVGRAAFIERSLGLADGAFANRPHPWLIFRLRDIEFIERSLRLADSAVASRPYRWLIARLPRTKRKDIEGKDSKWKDIEWKVDHRTGISTIYVACVAVWLFLLLTSLLVSAWAQVAAFGFAVVATWRARTWIKHKKEQVDRDMRSWAVEAVRKACSSDVLRVPEERQSLIKVCSKLGHRDEDTITGRVQFYAATDRDTSSYYLPCISKEEAACQLVALLTDLSPRWLFDCSANRRGSLAQSPVSGANEPR